MKPIDLLQSMDIFPTKSEIYKWIAIGSVKINGKPVNINDDIDENEVISIEVGKSVKMITPPLTILESFEQPK